MRAFGRALIIAGLVELAIVGYLQVSGMANLAGWILGVGIVVFVVGIALSAAAGMFRSV